MHRGRHGVLGNRTWSGEGREETVKTHSLPFESLSPLLVDHVGGCSYRSRLQAETIACCPTWKIWPWAERRKPGWVMPSAHTGYFPSTFLPPLLSGLFSISTFRNPYQLILPQAGCDLFCVVFFCSWFDSGVLAPGFDLPFVSGTFRLKYVNLVWAFPKGAKPMQNWLEENLANQGTPYLRICIWHCPTKLR